MEIDGVKTGKQPKMRCVFCKRWSELDPATWNDLEAEPCPNCGETGSDVRALQEKVKGCAQSQSQLPQERGGAYGCLGHLQSQAKMVCSLVD